MWMSDVVRLDSTTCRYALEDDAGPVTWRQVASLWQSNPDFTVWFSTVLAESPLSAFFWETPPLVASRWQDPFEFVLVASPTLAGVSANPRAFAGLLESHDPVVAFDNLSGDAHLIAPTRGDGTADSAHLAAFVRTATAEATDALWSAVGHALEMRVGSNPIWCSTSGLGVLWLHVRLDTHPKYYTHAPYRRLPT